MNNISINIYQLALVIISISLAIITIYNKIKYLCLKKASEMVARAESKTELTGEEKFALVYTWIEEDLPKIFKNTLFRSIVETIIEYVYKNSYDFMKKYVKRKTGEDIDVIINQIKEAAKDSGIDMK